MRKVKAHRRKTGITPEVVACSAQVSTNDINKRLGRILDSEGHLSRKARVQDILSEIF